MNISRKDFFRQALFSVGKGALEITATVRGTLPAVHEPPPTSSAPAAPDLAMVAVPFNDRCLAKNCGCFACVERCEPQAISWVAGEGIRVDKERCSGCGTCEYVCPVFPKAVALTPREKV